MKPVRVAVFGCGHLGRIHARLIRNHPSCEFVGVYDTVAASRDAIAREFNTVAWHDAEVLARQIDAAVIATPTRFHHAVAADLLRRDVHCLVEKPVTTTLDEADELVDLAVRHQRVLQVGHVERFNPAWRAVRPLITQPRFLHATRASGYTFRSTDVGVVLDLMIHDLDLVLSTLTAELVQVHAWGQAVVGPHEDVAHARLQFADGAVAQLSASRVSLQNQRSMQIVCDDAHFSLDMAAGSAKVAKLSARLMRGDVDPNSLSLEERMQLRDHFFSDLMPVEEVAVAPSNAIEAEQRDFLEAIRGSHSPQVTGSAARRTLAVAQQIVDQIALGTREAHAAPPSSTPRVNHRKAG